MQFFVQHWIQDGVDLFHILHQQWTPKSQWRFQVLHERGIRKRSRRYLLFFVVLQNVVECLSRGVNHQRVPVELVKNYGVFNAEIILGQSTCLPNQSVTRFGQVLSVRKVLLVDQSYWLQVFPPIRHKDPPVEVVEEANVGEKGATNQDIATHASHLLLEVLGRNRPPILFRAEVVLQGLSPFHFGLHCLHLDLDQLCLSGQFGIVHLILIDLLLQFIQQLLEFIPLLDQSRFGFLQFFDLLRQGLHLCEHVGILELGVHPFGQKAGRLAGEFDFFWVPLRKVEIAVKDFILHALLEMLGVKAGDVAHEVILIDFRAHFLPSPVLGLVLGEGANCLQGDFDCGGRLLVGLQFPQTLVVQVLHILLCVLQGRLHFRQFFVHAFLLLHYLLVLDLDLLLQQLRVLLFLRRLKLLFHHQIQLFRWFLLLRFQLHLLYRQTLLQIDDRILRFFQLLQPHIQVELLLLQLLLFRTVQLDEMLDEIQEIPRSQKVEFLSRLLQLLIQLNHSVVNVHYRRNYRGAPQFHILLIFLSKLKVNSIKKQLPQKTNPAADRFAA